MLVVLKQTELAGERRGQKGWRLRPMSQAQPPRAYGYSLLCALVTVGSEVTVQQLKSFFLPSGQGLSQIISGPLAIIMA